jgi:replicative DNA helicase
MFMTPQEFAQAEFKLDWLIPKVLVAGQPCIVGGPSKTLKTSIMIDLAVSLGAGSPARFLGKFAVGKEGIRVGFISGESGGATIKEIFRRVCAVRGTDLQSCNVYPEFRLPKLSQNQELQHLTSQIRHHELKVIIIDPIYLSLLAGNQHAKAANLFDMGPLLKNITESCLEAGATPILVHHTTKRLPPANNNGLFEPIDLEDLAMSGFSEFARQWMLINRRNRYLDGSGKHELYVRMGGSAGFNNLWAVNINEGKLDEDFNGRKWTIMVSDQEKLREIEAEQHRARRELKKLEQEQDMKKQLLAALATFPNGETGTALKEAAGLSKNTQVMHLLNQMVREGLIAPAQIDKPCGKQIRSYPGFTSLQGWGPAPSGTNAIATPPTSDQDTTSHFVDEVLIDPSDES